MAWFVKIERGIVDKQKFDQFVPAHKLYVQSLIELGHCAVTGYWKDYGGGMLLFQADCLDQAIKKKKNDPLIVNGCVKYEVHQWQIVVASPKKLNFGSQRGQASSPH